MLKTPKRAWILPISVLNRQNPSLSCAFTDKLPALSMTQQSKIIRDYFNIIHKAREAFMMNENFEKIRIALRQYTYFKWQHMRYRWLCTSLHQKIKRTSQSSRKRWIIGPDKTRRYMCSLPFLPSLIRTVKSTSAHLTNSNSIKQ